MKHSRKFLLAGFLFSLVASKAALADSIPFYNTGEAANGSILASGASDPHYTLIYASDGDAYTATATTPNAAWATPTGTAGWISPGASGNQSWDAAYFVYQTTLDLTGYDSATAVLSGDVAADNHIYIYLNGVDEFNSTGFSSQTPFSLTSGFMAGVNTVDFVVLNDSGPTGLLVDNTSATASPTPEPGSLILLATGAVVFTATMRKRLVTSS